MVELTSVVFFFRYMRQHSPVNNPGKLRLLDCDPKMCSGLLNPPEEVAHNAIIVRWNPLSDTAAAYVNVAIRCLSTDFTSQKGVKGIPLHIQVGHES